MNNKCSDCVHNDVCSKLGKALLKLSIDLGYPKEAMSNKNDSAFSRVVLNDTFEKTFKCDCFKEVK